LAAGLAAFGNRIPDRRAGNFETPSAFGNADAGIIANEAVVRDGFQ